MEPSTPAPTGLEGFICNLIGDGSGCNSIPGTTLYTQFWDLITEIAPFVVMVFVVAVGYYVLRRVISKGSRLKAGI